MNIGIRKNVMLMFINTLLRCLILISLFIPSLTSYGQSSDWDNSPIISHDTVKHVDISTSEICTVSGDSMPNCSNFKVKQLILPGTLIAIGSLGVYSATFRKLNKNIKNGMENLRGNNFMRVDDYIQYLPAITYLTFGSIGIKSKHSIKERIVVEATAYVSMAALTNIGKYSFRERRPDSNARNSFPSGHTATAFTGAELMREEYGVGFGIGAYSAACCVAFLRLYNGRHWLNDVVAGAGIGILSARIGYWMLPLYQKWFKWKPTCHYMFISPSYNYDDHSFSVNLLYNF